MIDQQLIQDTSNHLCVSLDDREPTALKHLYIIKNALTDEVLSKLQKYLQSDKPLNWQVLPGQEKKPRDRISWDFDTVIEELHEIFNSSTDKINDLFPDPHKNFWGVSLWRDRPGYEIGWHTDNPDIDVAVQVYLYTLPGLGTEFKSGDETVIVSSQHNCGYLVCHSGDEKIPHKTENIIPEGITRYSLYAIWSRFPKSTADS